MGGIFTTVKPIPNPMKTVQDWTPAPKTLDEMPKSEYCQMLYVLSGNTFRQYMALIDPQSRAGVPKFNWFQWPLRNIAKQVTKFPKGSQYQIVQL
jgi:hypothetical protein